MFSESRDIELDLSHSGIVTYIFCSCWSCFESICITLLLNHLWHPQKDHKGPQRPQWTPNDPYMTPNDHQRTFNGPQMTFMWPPMNLQMHPKWPQTTPQFLQKMISESRDIESDLSHSDLHFLLLLILFWKCLYYPLTQSFMALWFLFCKRGEEDEKLFSLASIITSKKS